MQIIRERYSLPMEAAEIVLVEELLQNDPEGHDSDIVCVKCLSGEVTGCHHILRCDGDHSWTDGYRQWCRVPLVAQLPDRS